MKALHPDMTYNKLTPMEQWMVRSNLKTIRETKVPKAQQVATLRRNGYPKIADAVNEMAD